MAKKKTTKKKSEGSLINVNVADNSCKPAMKAPCGGSYGLGVLGAAIYFINTSTGFWNGVWGILKAIVWPASLIFEVLKYIGA